MTVDREKIIKGLQEAVAVINDHVPVRYVGYAEAACLDAITLLREQEPMKPELRMSKHGFRQWIVCGNCYGKMRGVYDYCPWCGRKVKWK